MLKLDKPKDMQATTVFYLLNAENRDVTVCTVFDPGTLKPLAVGYAVYSPKETNGFNYRLGSDIAQGRAMKALRTGMPNVTRAGNLKLVSRSFEANHYQFIVGIDPRFMRELKRMREITSNVR